MYENENFSFNTNENQNPVDTVQAEAVAAENVQPQAETVQPQEVPSQSIQTESVQPQVQAVQPQTQTWQQSAGVYQPAGSAPEMRLNTAYQTPKPKKKGGFFKKFLACIALGLCFGLFTGLGIYTVCETTGIFDKLAASEYESIEEIVADILEQNGSKTYMNIQSHGDAEVSSSGVAVTQPVQPSEDGVTAVVAEVMPAMVSIINTYVDEYSYFGQVVQQENSSSGSGIIVGENETELLIATNYHVVEKAKTLTVNFNDGSNAGAVVKGSDPDMDLAVIAVPLSTLKAETKSAIAIARLGDSNSLQLGQSVIAIGNALGYGQSVSGGYVSALNREISMEDGSTGTFIQTDAAINPGNSGGALLNMAGEVIGINSSKIGGSVVEGMGFAIPISAAQPILEELMTKKTRTELAEKQGYIGIRLQTVTEYDAQRYGMPTGIYVYEAIEGLAAANAGIVRGDIITKFDGTRLSTSEQLMEMIKYYNVGEEVEVVVQRSVNGVYQEMVITLVLGEAPAQ